MNLVRNDSAVSPVIGTILLVAITVVLVAIIAAVVMGMSNNVSSTKEVGLTVTPTVEKFNYYTDRSSLILGVMVYGGKDVSNLRALNVSVEGSARSLYVTKSAMYYNHPTSDSEKTFKASEIIGQTFHYRVVPTSSTVAYENALVTVTGDFADGTSAVLYQSRITYHTPSGASEFWTGSTVSGMSSPIFT